MKLTRLDAHQAWMISEGDVHVVLDPSARVRADGTHALLLSAHFDAERTPEALRAFDRGVSVHTTKQARPRLRALGFRDVTGHAPGSRFDVAGTFDVTTVVSAFPFAGNALGFLVESRAHGTRVYIESRLTDEARLIALPPGLDALVCPCEPVFAFLVQLSMDTERTARTIARLRPKRFLPTGSEPARSKGALGRFGRASKGTVEDLERVLVERRVPTEIIAAKPGDSIAL